MRKLLFLVACLAIIIVSCQPKFISAQPSDELIKEKEIAEDTVPAEVQTGADQVEVYIPMLKGRKIGLIVNQTSMVGDEHLVDLLVGKGVEVVKIFAPEHGFRGKADAGEKVADGKDAKTGIPLVSLYGSKKKPGKSDLAGMDMIVFDIQDVGARFYTYISTMSYVMEACAENGLSFLVLDRPNPNGHYVDGPIRKSGLKSFVGMHAVPIVHGMTVAEYARMVNEEGWLKGGVKCNLNYITCKNYNHKTFYELPVKPSPNLPNIRSIYLYPSLCLFEGTVVSVGRGTDTPFQIYGHPTYTAGDYNFKPSPREGAKSPKHNGKNCNGYSCLTIPLSELQAKAEFDPSYVIDFYNNSKNKNKFFNNFFDKLAGTPALRQDIIAGKSADEIKQSWAQEIADFKEIRSKYLLYTDFE